MLITKKIRQTGNEMNNRDNRLFTLPRDVRFTSVLNHLPTIRDRKAALRSLCEQARNADQAAKQESNANESYTSYLGFSLSTGPGILNFIANLDRADIAWFLQKHIGQNKELQIALQNRANNSAADYAVYALISNVVSLDIELLHAAMQELQAQGCSMRILNSLAVIRAYHVGVNFSPCLSADVAYVNLCGASLEGELRGKDLSYADLTGAMFNLACTGCNLESANFTGANLMSEAKLDECVTANINVTDARVAMGFVFESTEQLDGTRRFDVPELEPLILRQSVNIGSSTNIDRRQNGCSVM